MIKEVDRNIECHFSETFDTIDKRYIAHPKYEIFLLIEGDVTMLINSKRYLISNGALVLLNSKDLHISINNAKRVYKRITIMFDPRTIGQFNTKQTNLLDCFVIAAQRNRNIVYLSDEQIVNFKQLAKKIKSYCNSTNYGDDLLAFTSLVSLLVYINHIFKSHLPMISPLPLAPIIQDIVSYIDNHIEEELRVKLICEYFSYSISYISTRFSKQMGISIKQFILIKKISLAKQMLEKQFSVYEVCAKCGFGDYSNFIRTFKKYVGVPPLQWQKRQEMMKIQQITNDISI